MTTRRRGQSGKVLKSFVGEAKEKPKQYLSGGSLQCAPICTVLQQACEFRRKRNYVVTHTLSVSKIPIHSLNISSANQSARLEGCIAICLRCSFRIAAVILTLVMAGCMRIPTDAAYINGSRLTTDHVCIDLNTSVADDRFLSTLQLALQDRGVISDIYSPGAAPEICEVHLLYNVVVQYRIAPGGGEPTAYWSIIDLDTLRYGRIVATAHYDALPVKNRWIQTRIVAQMVARIITSQ
ncbi:MULTISPECIES: hypothetical protein [unclassified Paraburkholderia]|uniref:hypothetical protein n=1 Tax=unclassified Paraburkholderia TaxID=2615204 RepID=UPI002AB2F435|nr:MULTISPECIES: hypothetical protein [unclassified Paraburkholderia]